MAELSYNAQSVSRAVNTLYHSPNVQEKEKASFWLGEFQKSIFAWKTADELLQAKQDVESTYFAAQTMRTKILYSFHELPVETRDSLKQSILTHIEDLCGFSPALTTQLALAVCDLALQMPEWNMPAATFIKKYGEDPQALSYLLEILTVLPEEINSRHLRLGENRRCTILEEMENSAPMVIDVMQSCLANNFHDEHVLSKVFQCLGSWFYLGVFPGNHVARRKILSLPFQVLGNPKASSSLHQAATDCICSALYMAEDVSNNCDLIQQLFTEVLALRQTYCFAMASEDTDKCLNLCRVFTELAESLIDVTISMPGQGFGNLEVLDILLICVDHCQYEVADITFNYWYRLSEALYAMDHETVHQIYSSFIERLIFSLVRHCQMEPDHNCILEPSDDFADFRASAADLVKDVVHIVGPTECFLGLFKMLTGEIGTDVHKQPEVTWDVTESILYIMTSIAKNVKADEEIVIPQVLGAILSLPPTTHVAVRHTSIQLVGELSSWIEKHPRMLNPTLQFLTEALEIKEFASAAATSIQYLCEVCQSQMIQHYAALIQLIQVADDLLVSSDATLGLLKGVSTVLSHLPYDKAQIALAELCRSQVSGLNQSCHVFRKEYTNDKYSKKSHPIIWLDRLAVIFRNFSWRTPAQGLVHPCKSVVEEMWPVFQAVLDKFQIDNKIVERWCRCIRFAVRCVKKAIMMSLLPHLVVTMSNAYKTSSHSCFLYLGSVLVDEYGNDDQASTMLFEMLETCSPTTFNLLGQENGLVDHPDTVDDLFRLCSRFVERCPNKFFSRAVSSSLLQCALESLSLEHRDANASVTKFLKNVIDTEVNLQNQPNVTDSVLSGFGEKIIERSLIASLLSLPSYLYPDIADLWWAVMQKDIQSFKIWLEKSLKNLPSQASLATATHSQILDFLKDVVDAKELSEVSYRLRDFCLLYR